MKIKFGFGLIVALLIIVAAILFGSKPSRADGPPVLPIIAAVDAQAFRASTAEAAPVGPSYSGFLEFKVPTWTEGQGYVSNWRQSAEIGGEIKLHNLFGALTPYASGNYSFGKASNEVFPYTAWRAGLEFALAPDVTLFSHYERWHTADVNRVFCGIRLGFRGGTR